MMNLWLREEYPQDPKMTCSIEQCEPLDFVISAEASKALMSCLKQIPQGVVKMSYAMPGTVETSNNVGRISSAEDHIFVSTHTRSFIDDDMTALSKQIADTFKKQGAESEVMMSAPAWQENQQSLCWAGARVWLLCTLCSKRGSLFSIILASRLPVSALVSLNLTQQVNV